MPLTTGLAPAALICGVLGTAGLVVLFLAARRSAIRLRPDGALALRLFAASIAAGAGGLVAVAVTATPVAGRSSTLSDVSLFDIALFDLSFGLSTVLLVAGLLVLPQVAATGRARTRHVVDGLLLAAGGFFASWALLIEPLHQRYLGDPVPIRLTGACLVIAVPSLLAVATLGLLVVFAARAARPRGAVLACCAGAGLAAVSGLGLVLALRYGDRVTVLATAAGYAGGHLLVAGSAGTADRLPAAPPGPTADRLPISLVPVSLVTVAVLIRLIRGEALDTVGLSTAVVICVALAAQVALDRRELRHFAEHKARSEEQYRVMAHTDALTGLGNRRQLLRTLNDEAVGGPPCVLLAIDLDGFKNINDTRGHDIGDEVLVEVAERLRTNLRPGDLAARLGGDEFAVLMWARSAEALVVSGRLLGVLSQPYELATGTVFVSASIGLAGCATADDVPTLLRNADLALRFAKQRGKRRVEQYDQVYDEQVRRRTELEHELRGAAERGELMVVYQPVFRLPDVRHDNAQVVGVEALLRWHHPRLGPVPPQEFIPLAEESGLISGLGSFVLHEACHQLSSWRSEGHDVWLAVNVSVRELHTREYATELAEVLRLHRLPADQLVVEVTEHAVAVDLAQVVERLTALRATGVRVALDDFGSGYSSLSQLRTLPVDIIKIDRSFLSAPDRSAARFAAPLVDVVARLGNRLGLDVVAEGITEPWQCRMLQEAGCRYAQGTLLGAAMPAERVEAVFGVDLPLPEPAAPRPPAPRPAAPRPAAPRPPAPTSQTPHAQNVGPVDSGHEMRQS